MGLAKVDHSLTVLSIPFLFHSREEFNAVFDQMKPIFEKLIEGKGFKVMFWTLAAGSTSSPRARSSSPMT